MSGRDVLVFTNTEHADTPYDEWAQGTGVNLWLLTSDERFPGYAHLPNVWAFPRYWSNLEIERQAIRLAWKLELGAVIARSEPDILRAARLRDYLGVSGQGWDSAIAFRDKILMKSVLARHGIAVPEFARIEVALDLLTFIERHGYPVVVKPILGGGSTDVHVLRKDADLDVLFAVGLPGPAEVERFVEGAMFSVDGLVVDGELVASYPGRYVDGCLAFRDGDYMSALYLPGSDPMARRLTRYARQVLDILPTPQHTTIHLEVFHTPEDELVFCEIASRTTGGMGVQAIHAMSGLHLDREWFNAQLGIAGGVGPAEFQDARMVAADVLFYARTGDLLALPGEPPPYVVDRRIRGRIGGRYSGGVKSGDYIAAYVVVADDLAALEARVAELADWYEGGVRWSTD